MGGHVTFRVTRALRLALLPLLAAPMSVRAQDPATLLTPAASEMDRQCLTLAVAYEAGSEPLAGQQAVAEVVLNRMAHPAFPKSVCGVVFQGWRRSTGCQFTFTCDGALRRRLLPRTLSAARAVADAVLSGDAPRRVPGALNYHADYVHPYWAPTLDRVTKLGAHIFYKPQTGGVPVSGKERDWSLDLPDPQVIARAAQVDAASLPALAAVAAPRMRTAAPHDPQVFAPWGLPLQR
ncbi:MULTISPECIES: cell wall hydrolase [Novosphingobium]|uniref:cell wall hydrolase n=1 Tax=Novosphingobium TaxID=165696 RepID=UPI001CD25643|nr:cell wall hydrolase [Novosphingobium percolationis]MCH7629346.1 cell wall hydrolase [Pseudomonadota bacterium]